MIRLILFKDSSGKYLSFELLESNEVAFDLVYVDKLEADERRKAVDELTRWNPDRTFPTVVIDDSRVVRGYKPDEVREALGL